jgi:hypothetical protein
MPYLVTAPLVLVRVPDQIGDGYRVDYHYAGSVVPWLSEEQAEHFEAEGLVAKLAASDVAPELRKPAKTATHEKWVDYVHNVHGVDHGEASKLDKSELIELYG